MVGKILIVAFLIAAPECAYIASPFINQAEERSHRMNVTRRIRHGTEASYEQYPFLVYFEYITQEHPYICTGSFIALRWILTAAHCLPLMKEIVESGEFELGIVSVADEKVSQTDPKKRKPGGRRVKVASVHIHPDYYEPFVNQDTGLIQLAEDVPDIGLISLPAPHEDREAIGSHLPAKMVAAGLIDPGRPYSKLTFVQGTNCGIPETKRLGKMYGFYLCSQSDCALTIMCEGDSGAPIFFSSIFTSHREDDVIIATVALGNRNCRELGHDELVYNQTEYYASVGDAVPWILETLDKDYVDTRNIDLRRLWAEHKD